MPQNQLHLQLQTCDYDIYGKSTIRIDSFCKKMNFSIQ